MYVYERVYISPHYRPEEFLSLNLSPDSDENVWEKAVEILNDRLRGRHLDAIELLIGKTYDYPTNNIDFSFSIMALMCLVIETLHQFYYGLDQTAWGQHRDAFVYFIVDSPFFGQYFDRAEARLFYDHIRNGILHQAQTKKNTQLTILSERMVQRVPLGIRVDVMIFYEALKQEIQRYISRLLNPEEQNLRVNFITKMGYITRSF